MLHVKSLRSPGQLLKYAVDNEAVADVITLQAILRRLGSLLTLGVRGSAAEGSLISSGQEWGFAEVTSDGRFHILLAALTSRLEACNSRALALSADAAARLCAPTPELQRLLEGAAETLVTRENAFTPRSLTILALALASRGVHGEVAGAKALSVASGPPGLDADNAIAVAQQTGPWGSAVTFVRIEALRQMQEFSPACCVALLEAFRRWGVFDPVLVDVTLERFWEALDEVTTSDVVDALAVMSKLGLVRRALLQRLHQLVFASLQQFSCHQVVSMLHSLARLRLLGPKDLEDALTVLSPRLGLLSASELAQLLLTLAMTDAQEEHSTLARILVVQYTAKDRGLRDVLSDIDAAWAICALGLASDYRGALGSIVARLFRGTLPQHRVQRLKLFDVFLAMDLVGMRVDAPPRWRFVTKRSTLREAERLSESPLHSEVAEILGSFSIHRLEEKETSPSAWKRSSSPSGCPVDFLHEATRLVVDLETVSWPISRRVKHAFLEEQGYRPIRLEYWDLQAARHAKTDRQALVARRMAQALRGSFFTSE